MEPSPSEVTLYLQQLQTGDRSAIDRLLPHIYEDLRRIAESVFQSQKPEHTLQPTVLVHEAYLRLVKQEEAGYRDRHHFLSVAAMAMRQLLTDHARAQRAQKRPGRDRRVLLEDAAIEAPGTEVDLVALDEALDELKKLDERQARMVELRFFAGLSMKETAEVIGISERTAYLDWKMARRWMERRLVG